MTRISQTGLRAALAASLFSLSLGAAAFADTTYKIHKIIIKGNKSVATDVLMAKVATQPGSKVGADAISADAKSILEAYQKVPVDVNINATLNPAGSGSYDAVFTLVETASAPPPPPVKVNPKLHVMTFDGNKKIDSDTLAAAAGAKPGDELTNEKVAAMQQAIVAVYKAKNLGVTVDGENKNNNDGTYDVIWHITEGNHK